VIWTEGHVRWQKNFGGRRTTEKKSKKRKLALLSLFQGGKGQRKKAENSKKNTEK